MDYSNADTFGRDYLCSELMSKYPEWDLGIDREQVALSKFREAERICLDTNRRSLQSFGSPIVGPPAHPIFIMAMRKIERLLGSFSWPEVFRRATWGPGATTRLTRRERDVYYKFKGLPQVTHDLYPLAAKMVKSIPGWDVPNLEVVHGNRVTTVPKNAKTDRVIAIEPDLNMVVQLGIGKCIRDRLSRVGLLVDKPSWTAQQSNAELARVGSETGRLCTIDLSSASDTISKEVVRSLLPTRWYEALEQSRSPSGVLPSGEVITFQKISSMGNGYTFELETLIFWALASSVVDTLGLEERRVLVYGDDIIVATEAYPLLVEILELAGFTVNTKKSWAVGTFRESCGKHYFQGIDVTPFYIRRPVNDVNRLYWFANAVRRWSRLSWGLDPTYHGSYQDAVNLIPKRWRLLIPDGCGDGGLISDFDEAVPPTVGRRKETMGHEGYRYRALTASITRQLPSDDPYLTKALYVLERGQPNLSEDWELEQDLSNDPSRLEIRRPHKYPRFKITNSVAPQWPSYGPWL
jgi:hypothetical protein